MTKSEFIKTLSKALPEDLNLSQKNLTEIFNITFDTMVDVLEEEEKFTVPGFGTFKIKHRAERDGFNPKTREKIKIKASKSIGFKLAPKLKEKLN